MTTLDRTQLATSVYATSHITGEFVLRSGAVSNEYFDKYRFEADPVLLHEIAAALVPLVPPDTDALAGLELGGVPIATDALAGHRDPRLLRAQGGQDLRHVPARGGRHDRGAATDRRGGRRHVGGPGRDLVR